MSKLVLILGISIAVFCGQSFAEDNFLKMRVSNRGDLYHIFTTNTGTLQFGYKFFRSDTEFWSWSSEVSWNVFENFWIGPSAELTSNNQEKLGGRFHYLDSWKIGKNKVVGYLEGALLLNPAKDDHFFEIFAQTDISLEIGFHYGLQIWALREGSVQEVHLSPLRIGWIFSKPTKSVDFVIPFIMWRPVLANGKWNNRLYFGIDLSF